MKSSDSGSPKLERKIVEKNRRIQMKSLCFKLYSLIPKQHINSSSKDVWTQLDHLDQAATYISKLQAKVERLKQRRDFKMSKEGTNKDMMMISSGMKTGLRLPVVEVRDHGCNLEVVLISGLLERFKLHEVISVLEEEGAQVVNASFSVVGDKVFHTIHTQAMNSRIGVDAWIVSERLKELIR